MRLALFFLMATMVGACGDVCARAGEVTNSFVKKESACVATAAAVPFDEERCATSLTSCSSSDLSTVETYLDCLDALPACSSDDKASFSAKVLGCAGGMQSLAPGCFQFKTK